MIDMEKKNKELVETVGISILSIILSLNPVVLSKPGPIENVMWFIMFFIPCFLGLTFLYYIGKNLYKINKISKGEAC
jgi:hypothetical protein